jgi:hypothetical protein
MNPTPATAAPVLHRADVDAALAATGCAPEEAAAEYPDGELTLRLPSVGAAMAFAAALAAELIAAATEDDPPGTGQITGAGLATEIMARASSFWVPLPPPAAAHDGEAQLVVQFTGVRLTGDAPSL